MRPKEAQTKIFGTEIPANAKSQILHYLILSHFEL